jgi:hypothetical protein
MTVSCCCCHVHQPRRALRHISCFPGCTAPRVPCQDARLQRRKAKCGVTTLGNAPGQQLAELQARFKPDRPGLASAGAVNRRRAVALHYMLRPCYTVYRIQIAHHTANCSPHFTCPMDRQVGPRCCCFAAHLDGQHQLLPRMHCFTSAIRM